MTARYTTDELLKLAKDEGPLALSNLRQAIVWAAQTLEAADAAVKAEYERACWEKSLADAQPVKQADHADLIKRLRFRATQGYTLCDEAADALEGAKP